MSAERLSLADGGIPVYCDTPCKECGHCALCGGSEKRGGPYGCTCDYEDDDFDDDDD